MKKKGRRTEWRRKWERDRKRWERQENMHWERCPRGRKEWQWSGCNLTCKFRVCKGPHVCMYACVYVRMHACMYVYVCVCTRMYVRLPSTLRETIWGLEVGLMDSPIHVESFAKWGKPWKNTHMKCMQRNFKIYKLVVSTPRVVNVKLRKWKSHLELRLLRYIMCHIIWKLILYNYHKWNQPSLTYLLSYLSHFFFLQKFIFDLLIGLPLYTLCC